MLRSWELFKVSVATPLATDTMTSAGLSVEFTRLSWHFQASTRLLTGLKSPVASRAMLDHVFTDVISALREAFERALLERQAFEEHFHVDVLLGDLSWETSYGLPGEDRPPRVLAHITFDWPSWSQTAYRKWYLEEELEDRPAIDIEIVLRIQRIGQMPDLTGIRERLPTTSPVIGDGSLERATLTVETTYTTDVSNPEHAIEATYEGQYELTEESLADGTNSVLDDHFEALGGWIAAMLVRMADLDFSFLPPDKDS